MTMMEAEDRRTHGQAAERPRGPDEAAEATTEKGPDAVGTIVVKIGGSTLGSHDTTLEDLVALQSQGIQPIVVHGGGKTISEWMERQGVRPRFVRGLRVTDEPSLDIVVGVLSGVVNKAIVASILALNGRAVGLSGVDGGMLRAKVMEPELGLVGSVVEVDPRPARAVIEAGFMPVIAPVAVRSSEAGAHGGSLLNVNADTAAGEIALALGAERLVFLTDVAGVMDSSRRVMPRLTQRQAAGLMGSGVVAGGMVPKIGACLRALDEVGSTHIIDGREPHALREVLSGADLGTRVG
jgi:acetylglutamate kinase